MKKLLSLLIIAMAWAAAFAQGAAPEEEAPTPPRHWKKTITLGLS